MKVLVVAVALGIASAHAAAAPAPLPPLVSWRAPLGCGNEDAVRTAIAARAGRDRADGGQPYAAVDVTARADGIHVHVELLASGKVTAHDLVAPSCDAAADAVEQLVAAAWGPPSDLPPLLSWAAPVGCGDEQQLRALIGRRANHTKTDGGAPFAIVEVERDAGGYVARMQIRSDQGVEHRDVHGETCDKVADAVAWVLALAWSPPSPAPRLVRAAPHPARRHAPLPLHLLASVHAAYDFGTLPGSSAGAGLAVGVAYAHVASLELGGSWWGKQFEPVMPGAPAGVNVGLEALDARVCALPVFACAGLELGQLGGSGVNIDGARSTSLRWVAATAGIRWQRAMTRSVSLVVESDIVVPLGRPEFTLDDGTMVFRPAAASARFDLGLEFAPSW